MKRVFCLAFLASLLVASLGSAQTIEFLNTKDDRVEVETRTPVVIAFKTTCKDNVWKILPDKDAKGKQLIFSVRAYSNDPSVVELIVFPYSDGNYNLIVSGALSDKVAMKVCLIVSSGGQPSPPLPPTPPKPPVPPTPPDPPKPPPTPPPAPEVKLNEFGKLVLEQAVKVNRKSEAAGLGEAYAEVVASIRTGDIKTPEAAVKGSFTRNAKVLSNSAQQWSGFFAWLDNELTRRNEKGTLTTMAQHADHFEQLSAALREAGK